MPDTRTQAQRDYQRDYQQSWRERHGTSVGRYTLTICAAGYDRPDLPLVVCGHAPGHPGPHRDVHWAVEWDLSRDKGQR